MLQMLDNADHGLLLRALAGAPLPLRLDSGPLLLALGGEVLAFDAAGGLVLGFSPDETYLQGRGVVQGGVVAALLDYALAFCVLARLPAGDTHATVSLTVNYLRPVPAGPVRVEAVAERMGQQVAHASARLLVGPERVLAATATSTLALQRAVPPAGRSWR